MGGGLDVNLGFFFFSSETEKVPSFVPYGYLLAQIYRPFLLPIGESP